LKLQIFKNNNLLLHKNTSEMPVAFKNDLTLKETQKKNMNRVGILSEQLLQNLIPNLIEAI